MSISTSGLDFDHIDDSVRIQDDLYRYFNGGWLKTAVIPADRVSDGAGVKLMDISEKQVRAIIESATGSAEARKISELYASFMAEEAIEEKGYSPILSDLAMCDSIQSLSDFISTMSWLEARGLGGVFASFIYADQMDASKNILYLSQGGISLPDESYYREDQHAHIRTAFLAHVEAMFLLVGIKEAADLAAKILALETSIASHHFDAVKDRDATLTYNKMSRAEVTALMPAFEFDLYVSAGEIPSIVLDSVIVQQPPFFAGLSTILSNFDRDSWVAWLKWKIIRFWRS